MTSGLGSPLQRRSLPGSVCHSPLVLRGMRARHGGPHVGMRALALVLALLLAAPLTVLLWRIGSYLVQQAL